MTTKLDMKHRPTPEYRFWLFDPEGDGLTFWRSAADRDAEAKRVIACYLEDSWAEEVESVCAGEVTHTAQMTDKKMRPDDLDEDGCDGDGVYWSDCEWMGNYTLEPLTPNALDQRPAAGRSGASEG